MNTKINLQLFDEGFTQSELSLLSACGQKWNYRYNQLLQKRGSFAMYFLVGQASHDTWETFYSTGGERCNVATLSFPDGVIPSIKDIEKLNYWNVVLPAMFRAYTIYAKNDHKKWDIVSFEETVDLTYRNIRLRGKIDLTVESNGLYVVDHKTTSRIGVDTINGWDFRFQFMFYVWLKWKLLGKKPAGFIINAMKKPELRVKKTESLLEFAERVFQDMIYNTDKYFYRDKMPLTREALEHFEKEVLDPKIDKLLFIRAAALAGNDENNRLVEAIIGDKNTEECQRLGMSVCPFLDLCRHGRKMLFQYDTLTTKHLELETIEE